MSYRIRYARVGNAEPVYAVDRIAVGETVLCSTVEDVARIVGRASKAKAVRLACREARETGESEFLI